MKIFYLLIHSALAAPSFGNFCALLYLHSLYCTALFMQQWRVSHIIVTYINNTYFNTYNVSPFFSVLNYIKKNSPDTVKYNFPGSDIVWCEKPKVNVV